MKLRALPRSANGRRGVSIIEAAIVMPLLFLLLLGMLEYSWIFLNTQEINNAARHGARLGIVQGATAAEIQAAVDQLMNDAGLGSSGYQILLTPPDPATLQPGDPFTVRVTVDYSQIELIGIPMIPTPASLNGATTMACEGPL